ncbi:hypothetical protein A2714_05395 [Candidatus Woesebacteria bacterium RIFCSPHIGHO2_01_FULL_38_9]|uniref:Cell division protein FtsL n=2 Tax=Candidatus Woeseibacteriota TaxID=1752722 RepID=A0A1F7Y365_9BACT|nr:MAG: hypothetical protein A2714_05395 [Candidatus Woesebacteria bacterium RIFCSPHIGHO2_01_FULL_38_9]OGM59091.1 MAG: hypothetical protein A3A75_05515 [Candidatus Woesebacteria bacterium RIFCSPLOWO2_01_FULL_39_10]
MKTHLVEKIKVLFERFTNLVLVFTILILSLSLTRNISRVKQISLLVEKEEGKVKALENEKEELEKRLQEVQSEEFIEKQLRDKLGLAREGEIIVVLPEDELVKKFAPKFEEEEENLPDPNWKKWLKLFI